MKKYFIKILMLISIAVCCLTVPAFAQYSDVTADTIYSNAVINLSRMGIIGGYDDGTFHPQDSLTRAQLMKVIVISLGKGDEALAKNYSTIFSDIPTDYWANGYINVAVENNIITGYSDGTFKPEQEVSYSQGVTILLRALGYSSSDIKGVWPQNYIEKAKSLKISDGINLSANSILTRADLCLLLDRTLATKTKGTTKTLAEQSELGSAKTCVIYNSWDIDGSLSKGVIKTDGGDYNIGDAKGINYLGKKVNVIVDSSNNLLSFGEILENSKVMFVNTVAGNEVTCTTTKGDEKINIPDNIYFYYGGQKSLFSAIKSNVEPGSIIALSITRGTSDLYDYGVLVDPNAYQPIVVKKDVDNNDNSIGNIAISDKSKYTVIKDGSKVLFADIKQNDVIYNIVNPFKSGSGIVLVYDDKITGTYDEASPSKHAATKVTILNTKYDIETATAGQKLNDSDGAFNIGDKITLLLGSTGKIVDVIRPNSADTSNIALVVSTRKSNTQFLSRPGEQIKYYAKIYTLDGKTTEYESSANQATNKGKLVYYDFTDGLISLTPITYNKVYGKVNKEDKTIGDYWLSDNVTILDIYNNYLLDDVLVREVSVNDLPDEISEGSVIHAQIGGPFNDIQLLVVNLPVVNDLNQYERYGILVSRPERVSSNGDVAGSYTFIIKGKQISYYNESTIFNVEKNDIVYIEFSKYGYFTNAQALAPKDTSKTIQGVDSRRIKMNGKIYRLAKDVQAYDMTSGSPIQLSLDNLDMGDYEKVNIYAGNTTLTKGLIKMITIERE